MKGKLWRSVQGEFEKTSRKTAGTDGEVTDAEILASTGV
jgi:hypothetical protein